MHVKQIRFLIEFIVVFYFPFELSNDIVISYKTDKCMELIEHKIIIINMKNIFYSY